eukprot:366039-Chlamydomonas_euryale.AAC.20
MDYCAFFAPKELPFCLGARANFQILSDRVQQGSERLCSRPTFYRPATVFHAVRQSESGSYRELRLDSTRALRGIYAHVGGLHAPPPALRPSAAHAAVSGRHALTAPVSSPDCVMYVPHFGAPLMYHATRMVTERLLTAHPRLTIPVFYGGVSGSTTDRPSSAYSAFSPVA